MPTLLVVDDEPNVLYSLKKGLENDSLIVATADTAEKGIEFVRQDQPDVVILDVRLPDMSGLDAFDLIREIDPRLPVIVITAHSTTDTAIDAMKRGAFEYLLKPVDFHQLREVVTKAVELSRLRHVPAVFGDTDPSAAADRIIGRSPLMQDVYKAIGRVAPQNLTVLITGESGTGKELVARAIYHHSRRSDGPFMAINCAAIPESLLESELFGHERGAFTGADRRRIGKFEQANGGTIFLDELGDMSSATQAKVLRLLQDGQFERVGSNQTIEVDVRVIAATNQDLEAMIPAGEFRHDLFYRLNVFCIQLPALRERLDDLPLLVEHFLRLSNEELDKQVNGLAPETIQLLQRYDWPGNVRELQSVIKYAMVQSVGEFITPDCLPPALHPTPLIPPSHHQNGDTSSPFDLVQFVHRLLNSHDPQIYKRTQDVVDKIVLREVLDSVNGNQVRASELLGMSRTTLRNKLDNLEINPKPMLEPVSSDQNLNSR